MIDRQKIKEMNIKRDGLLLIVVAVVLFIFRTVILCLLGLKKDSMLYAFINFIISSILFLFWGWITYTVVMSKLYYYKTGRMYNTDRSDFKRDYFELTEYFKNSEPHKMDICDFKEQPWYKSRGIVLGTVKNKLISIPANSECNIAVFGPPGSGKTSGIAITNAITFFGAVLAVDIKGDLYNYVSQNSYRYIVRFCPDHPNALEESYHFDPFAGIEEMTVTEKKLYLESMATILIPEETGSDGYYFSSRARKMFQGITHLMLYENPNVSFPEVVKSILNGNPFDWVRKALNSDCVAAKEQIASFYGNNEKNVSAVYDTLTTAMVHFSNPVLNKLLTKSPRCISKDLLEGGYDIYLQISQEHLESYAPLFTLIIQTFCTAFTKRPDRSTGIETRPILMLLDEFPQLTFSYEMINTNLSTLRSKNIISLIIQQNVSQLEYRYEPIGARSIMGNCNVQVILGSNDMTTSTMFSDMCGYKRVLRRSNSETYASERSRGTTTQEATEKVFPPEYFGDLPYRNKLILYMKGKYLECDKLNCYNRDAM